MRYLLPLFWLLCVPPVFATDYAIFQHGEERTGWIWRGSQPIPGVNVPADAEVRPLPDGLQTDKIHEYKNEKGGLVHSPIIPPTPEPNPVAILDAEIDQKIKAAASDKSMTDDEFAKYRAALVRAKDIDNLEDKQNKVNDAEVLKPQARRTRNDIRRTIQAGRQQTESGRRQLSQSQVRRIKNPRS